MSVARTEVLEMVRSLPHDAEGEVYVTAPGAEGEHGAITTA